MSVIINELDIDVEQPREREVPDEVPREERPMPRPEDIREIMRHQLERTLRLEAT